MNNVQTLSRRLLFSIGPFVPIIIGCLAYTTLLTRAQTSATGFDISPYSEKDLDRIYQTLSSNVVAIARGAGTEHAFSDDNYYYHKEDGVYISRVTKIPVFDSTAKYESGTGWPSFYEPFDAQHVFEVLDADGRRVEVQEGRGHSHLGHVFNDGPPPTHLRYCINGYALEFIPRAEFNEQYGTQYLQPPLEHQHDTDTTLEQKSAL